MQRSKQLCPFEGCKEAIKLSDHDYCPFHSPCHGDEGWYTPGQCPSCEKHLLVLTSGPATTGYDKSWERMFRTIRYLRRAIVPAKLQVSQPTLWVYVLWVFGI